MANGLVSYVYVLDSSGTPHGFGPDDDLPDWAVEQMGPHCFEGGVKPSPKTPPSKSSRKESADD